MAGPEVHVGLGLVRRGDFWLVGRRASGRVFAGLWEFPGGRIEPVESPADAAIREVREETGLVVEAVADRGQVATAHAGRSVVLHLVECRPVRGEASATSPAVTEVRWVRTTALRNLEMPPANAEILTLLMAQRPDSGGE